MGGHMSAIRLDNLDISYGDTKVVHGVSLDIAEGESFSSKSIIFKNCRFTSASTGSKQPLRLSRRKDDPDR